MCVSSVFYHTVCDILLCFVYFVHCLKRLEIHKYFDEEETKNEKLQFFGWFREKNKNWTHSFLSFLFLPHLINKFIDFRFKRYRTKLTFCGLSFVSIKITRIRVFCLHFKETTVRKFHYSNFYSVEKSIETNKTRPVYGLTAPNGSQKFFFFFFKPPL